MEGDVGDKDEGGKRYKRCRGWLVEVGRRDRSARRARKHCGRSVTGNGAKRTSFGLCRGACVGASAG